MGACRPWTHSVIKDTFTNSSINAHLESHMCPVSCKAVAKLSRHHTYIQRVESVTEGTAPYQNMVAKGDVLPHHMGHPLRMSRLSNKDQSTEDS